MSARLSKADFADGLIGGGRRIADTTLYCASTGQPLPVHRVVPGRRLVAFAWLTGRRVGTLGCFNLTAAALTPMTLLPHLTVAGSSGTRRILDLTIVRIVLALFTTALAGGLTMAFVSGAAQRRFHVAWPEIFGALAALAAYAAYVRWIERRRVSELAGRGALVELGVGLAGGAAMVASVVSGLTLVGAYHFEGTSATGAALAAGFAQMAFVGVFEELLSRAIVFRLIERSLGTWAALLISSLLFGLAHLPGNGASALSVLIAVVAGAFFGAAYLATRRLWLCIGLHSGWNFTLGYVFSSAVSGHARTASLFSGHLDGPEWLTGGAYGLEASMPTLVVLICVSFWLLARARSHRHVITWRSRAARLRPSHLHLCQRASIGMDKFFL